MKLGTRRATPGILENSDSEKATDELYDEFATTGKRWLSAASEALERGPGPTKSLQFGANSWTGGPASWMTWPHAPAS